MGRKPKDQPEATNNEPNKFQVYSADGALVFEVEDIHPADIFKAMDVLKVQPPGAKLIRTSDGKTLQYTTAPKPEDNWIYNIQ